MTSDSRAAAWAAARLLGVAMMVLVCACTPAGLRTPEADHGIAIPYPHSHLIATVTWDFVNSVPQRKALGSDLWPCAWAIDDALYCAWGDGGGFDGNDDHIGRVSLGFARIEGVPSAENSHAIAGRNIWGSPPYSEFAAVFGGKVGSMTSVNGILYANGGFWTAENNADPTQKGGRGPLNSVAWSADLAKTWQIAQWSSQSPLGSFLDTGRDSKGAAPKYLLLYYMRNGDNQHLYLERIRSDRLTSDPATTHSYEYFTKASWFGRVAHWSSEEADAAPVFVDGNNVEGPSAVFDAALGRYLLTTGHYASGNDDDSSAGQVGLFESRNPWGPWATIGYYENWGNLKEETTGDFLSLRIPSKWISPDGRTFWAVFSGPKSFDSFNIVEGIFKVR